MPDDGEVMDRIHKLEVAQASQVSAAAGTEPPWLPPRPEQRPPPGRASPDWAMASGAGGFIVGIFLGMAIAKAKA